MDEAPSEEETNTATARPMFEPEAREDVVAPAQEIGRFMVLGRVGAGGMGQVYAAYDPVLDRRVALKLLHAERTEKDRDALVREAKALARLTHPHVVAVHDVGVHEGLVFLAMEYVEGRTLKEWAAGPKKGDLAASLDVLHQAGLGLAAAHEAGLVHGDFKPHNVLVGEDGRVRVADFGLARPDGAGKPRRARPATRTVSDGETLEDEARQVVAGTPAYMAPEHVREGRVDPRTDQYSFCVAAWEVLYGCRPPEVANAVELPSVVSAALKKGLAQRSSGRHGSMRPLLDALRVGSGELRGDRARWAGRVVGLGGAVAVAGAVGTAYWVGQVDEGAARCTGAEAALAKVWNADVETAVRSAILGTGAPFAEHTEGAVVERLDRFGSAWVEGYTDACEASQVRLEQSDEVMDLRMSCLDQRLRELRAVTGVLQSLTVEESSKAVQIVDGLAVPTSCSDLAYVRSAPDLPADPEKRARAGTVRDELAQVKALYAAGRYAEAESLAEESNHAAEAIDFVGLSAAAKFQLGQAQGATLKTAAAVENLKTSFLLSQTARDGRTASRAASALARELGERQHDREKGLQWAETALAIARGVDAEDGHLTARALSRKGAVLRVSGDHQAALELSRAARALVNDRSLRAAQFLVSEGVAMSFMPGKSGAAELEQALEIYEEHLGADHPRVADTLFNLAQAGVFLGNYRTGIERLSRAKEIYVATEGADGYNVGSTTALISVCRARQGDDEAAVAGFEEALRILEKTLGDEHVEVAGQYVRMGSSLSALGRTDAAIQALEHGVSLTRRAVGDQHPHLVAALATLANAQRAAGYLKDAESTYADALAALSEGQGPGGEAVIRANLGNLYDDQGRTRAAVREFELAVRGFAATPERPAYRVAQSNLAGAYLKLGRVDEALELAEDSMGRWHDGLPRQSLAHTQFLVARALWKAKGDRTRARRLAAEAEAAYIAVDADSFTEDIAAVRAWLAAHR